MSETEKKKGSLLTKKYCPFKPIANGFGQHRCDKSCALYFEETLKYEDGTVFRETSGCSFAVIADRLGEYK